MPGAISINFARFLPLPQALFTRVIACQRPVVPNSITRQSAMETVSMCSTVEVSGYLYANLHLHYSAKDVQRFVERHFTA